MLYLLEHPENTLKKKFILPQKWLKSYPFPLWTFFPKEKKSHLTGLTRSEKENWIPSPMVCLARLSIIFFNLNGYEFLINWRMTCQHSEKGLPWLKAQFRDIFNPENVYLCVGEEHAHFCVFVQSRKDSFLLAIGTKYMCLPGFPLFFIWILCQVVYVGWIYNWPLPDTLWERNALITLKAWCSLSPPDSPNLKYKCECIPRLHMNLTYYLKSLWDFWVKASSRNPIL